MSATPTAAVKVSTTASPGRSPTDVRSADTSPDQKFDRRLDDARKHQGEQERSGDAAGHPDAGSARASGARHASSDTVSRRQAAHAQGDVDGEPTDAASKDAAALAAMLAMLGQAVPATPLAAATSAALGTGPQKGLLPLGLAGQGPAAGKLPQGADAPTLPPFLLAAAAADGSASSTADSGTAFADLIAPATVDADHAAGAQDLSALVAAVGTSQPQPAAVAPAHAMTIQSPVGSPNFAADLGQQITWLGMQDVKQAKVRLHPQELGSLDVSISVNHNRVDVNFVVQHPAAAHAVQQSLAQLDNMLAQHGMSLGHTDVGQRHAGDGQQAGSQGGGMAALEGVDEAETGLRPLAHTAVPGLLDTFA